MEKTLFVHIGLPKTGTTALQLFLGLNQKRLYMDNYIFRDMLLRDYDHNTRIRNKEGEWITIEESRFFPKFRNGYFLHGSIDGTETENVRRLQQGFRIIKKWFEEKPNVILTDELIYRECNKWNYLERLRDFAASENITVRIIVFLRRQDDYMDSSYRQRVKNRFLTDTWEDFLEEHIHSHELHADYDKIADELSDLFGKKNMIIIPYEPSVWEKNGQSIYSVFLRTLGINKTEGYELPERVANESIGYGQTEIMRILNCLTEAKKPLSIDTKRFFKEISIACTGLSSEKRGLSYLTDEERGRLISEYEKGNNYISEEYLGGEALFSENAEGKEKWEYDPAAMQEEMILYFGYTAKRLHEEIRYLREHTISVYAVKQKLFRLKKRVLNLFRK